MKDLWKIITFALLDFWRNIWLSVNTITIITLSLLSINFLILVTIIINQAIVSVENRVNVSIYFKKEVTNTQVGVIKNRIEKQIELREARIISPEEALERFRLRYLNDLEILAALDELDENPFSFSLVVQAEHLSDYSALIQVFDEPAYVQLIEEKDFSDLASHERAIARVNEISNKAKTIGFGITLILILSSLLVVLNTIRLNIYTHREEIAIMRLVGANNWIIKGPFIVESIIYAFLSAGIAIAIIYPIVRFIDSLLPGLIGQSQFSLILFYQQNWLTLIGWQFIGVVVLTMLASSLAIRRYIKV